MIGKKIRMNRLFNKTSKKIFILPLDHGAYMGPISGIEDISKPIRAAYEGGADAILINPGIVRYIPEDIQGELGIILRITNTHVKSNYFPYEPPISSISNALSLGADAVSYTINIGGPDDALAIENYGIAVEECNRLGVPMLAEFLPAGDKMKDKFSADNVKYVARLASELGGDFIKTFYTGSADSFKEVTSTSLAPVVIAGGEKSGSDKEVLQMIKGAIDAGGGGSCVGRNLWQREKPLKMIQAVNKIVHEGISLEKAYSYLE